MSFYHLEKSKAFMVTQKALILENYRVLVLKNTINTGTQKPQWELPGGLLELDEALNIGLLREVREETGLDISIGKPVAVWDFWERAFKVRDGRTLDARMIGIAYQCQRIGGEIQLSSEHSHFQWATLMELKTLDFASNSRLAVEEYLSIKSE